MNNYESKVLKSKIDDSVNFITKYKDGGFFESRYVKRRDNDFICYLSSHSGCNRGCKFCHLTSTHQTMFSHASIEIYLEQAKRVLEHALNINDPSKYVKYSFMARGEPLANNTVLTDSSKLFYELGKLAVDFGLIPKFNISTIIPKTINTTLVDIFPIIKPRLYYSMYSTDVEFRKHWLPGAAVVDRALYLLTEYQESSDAPVTIHYSLIKDHNDSIRDIECIINKLNQFNLKVDINLVQFNTFSENYEAADNLKYKESFVNLSSSNKNILSINCINRIGFDVNASCGMFVNEGSV